MSYTPSRNVFCEITSTKAKLHSKWTWADFYCKHFWRGVGGARHSMTVVRYPGLPTEYNPEDVLRCGVVQTEAGKLMETNLAFSETGERACVRYSVRAWRRLGRSATVASAALWCLSAIWYLLGFSAPSASVEVQVHRFHQIADQPNPGWNRSASRSPRLAEATRGCNFCIKCVKGAPSHSTRISPLIH